MSPTDKNKSTKEKILSSANSLFAKHGFEGTSVREIASQADVNLAAINYHFKNKEKLYWDVFNYNYALINSGVEKIGKTTSTTEELTVGVFDFFISDDSAIMNTFKIFLSDNVVFPEEEHSDDHQEKFGPPGQEVFLEKIKNDLNGEGDKMSHQWAMKMIFSLLVHFGVILNTTMMKKKCEYDKELKPEMLKEAIRHSVRAHLDYLKSGQLLK